MRSTYWVEGASSIQLPSRSKTRCPDATTGTRSQS
jgi:hypothetical protein